MQITLPFAALSSSTERTKLYCFESSPTRSMPSSRCVNLRMPLPQSRSRRPFSSHAVNSSELSRSTEWPKNAVGVASAISPSVTTPAARPRSRKKSHSEGYAVPSAPMEIWRFSCASPVARALPPAAESVVKASRALFCCKPMLFSPISVRVLLANTAAMICDRPMPSPIRKITFFTLPFPLSFR